MPDLRKKGWEVLNSYELLMFLRNRLHAHGQFDSERNPDRDKVYFPFARDGCLFAVAIDGDSVTSIEPGAAFGAKKWSELADDINATLLTSTPKFGREFSFSSHRVFGWWRGTRSGIQILPPPADAPRAPVEAADHPFILEFPIRESRDWQITNYRRRREHRKLTLLLNALLASRISSQGERFSHSWIATDPIRQQQKFVEEMRRPFNWCARVILKSPSKWTSEWAQQSFFANLGPIITDSLSKPGGDRLQELESNDYYTNVRGLDGEGLRTTSDLDDSICLYAALSTEHRDKFDRAAFWLDIASRQWTISASASFAALVSAIEALTEGRGPGTTRRFTGFFDTYPTGFARCLPVASRTELRLPLNSHLIPGRGSSFNPPAQNAAAPAGKTEAVAFYAALLSRSAARSRSNWLSSSSSRNFRLLIRIGLGKFSAELRSQLRSVEL
jgi:hypothetical protein